jgi:hypothetical protein
MHEIFGHTVETKAARPACPNLKNDSNGRLLHSTLSK